MNKYLFIFFFAIVTLLGGGSVLAQGITTSTMSGEIRDAKGDVLPGATVIAIHQPSGSKYGVATRADGSFNLANLKSGGPYTITVSFVGYKDRKAENVFLELGQNFDLNVQLEDASKELEEVVITGVGNSVFDSEKTGASTTISTQQLATMPTISRSLNDFTRLTPQASTQGSGISFAGSNNRFNQFAIDGTVNNDVFGLSATGTNGGQAGINPISLDVIERMQVVLAPYDVRLSGFTGGGINAITRSGTNKLSGSVYNFFQNESLIGLSPDAQRTRLDAFSSTQWGARLGGAIIKDKLFFFASYERNDRTQALAFEPGTPNSNYSIEELQQVADKARSLGYDPGSFQGQNTSRFANFGFLRLDWNISDKHKLVLRHSYTDGQDIDITRNPNSVRFFNNAQKFPTTTNATVLELNSIFNSRMANEFRLGYTTVADRRTFLGDPFPTIRIDDPSNTTKSVILGPEQFSVANRLEQSILTITNNFNLFLGKHTLTFGTHNEIYSFSNLFLRENYGFYRYNSIQDFLSIGTGAEVLPRTYDLSYTTANPREQRPVSFNAAQLGFYVQDEWKLARTFKLTAGVRMDLPIYSTTPSRNESATLGLLLAQADARGTDELPAARPLWAPRVGFNWDIKGDKTTQLRGGVGIFTGRVPFVWISNQFANTGMDFTRFTLGSGVNFPANFVFRRDPNAQYTAAELGLAASTSEINVTSRNFRMPQVLRANLAVDQKLPFWGLIGTAEFMYTQTLNNINYRDLNLRDANTVTAGPDTRPLWTVSNRQTTAFTNVLLLENTNLGMTYNMTFQIQKPIEKGWSGSLAYTFGRATAINDGSSSQAVSNWRFMENGGNLNSLSVTRSDFDLGSRIVGSVNYTAKEFFGRVTPTVSLFYNGQSGIPLSYVYSRNVTAGAAGINDNVDLMYVPRGQNDIIFLPLNRTAPNGELIEVVSPEAQWQALDRFIEQDEYLSGIRGQVAQRNMARTPWTNQIDLRLMLDIKTTENTKLQLTWDVFNFGNLISKEWGRVYGISNNAAAPVNFSRLSTAADVTNGLAPAVNVPLFTFDETRLNNVDGSRRAYFINDFASRWRSQVGIRFLF